MRIDCPVSSSVIVMWARAGRIQRSDGSQVRQSASGSAEGGCVVKDRRFPPPQARNFPTMKLIHSLGVGYKYKWGSPTSMPRGKSSTKPYLVDAKRRVGISAEAAEALNVAPGDFVAYEVDGKTVKLRKATFRVE
jgi:hypothetical protein